MAEHKLRIDVKLGTKQAQQETKKLSDSFSGVKKEIEDTVKSANELNSEVGKKTECNIDVKKAEKKVEQLTKEINKLEEKAAKLKSGKRLGQYAEELNINHEAYVSKMKDAGRGATLEQFHKAMEAIDADNVKTKEVIRNKYAAELSELKEIQNAERNLVQQRSALKAKIELTRQAEEEHAKAVKETAKETDRSSKKQRVAASEAKKTATNQRAVTNEAKKTSRYQSKTSGETSRLGRLTKRIHSSWTGVRKTVLSVAKGAMIKLGGGIKNAAKLAGNIGSRIKQAVKPAENLRKKFLKIGLAMLGARSAFFMFKQVISEAMSNNKELQDQLQATKGVMGEALAPAIQLLVNALGKVVTFADRVYQLFTGTSLIAKYNAKQAQKQADATKDAAENAKEYQKQMASFDVANKLSDNSSSSSSASSGGSTDDSAIKFNEVDVDGWLEEILKKIKTRDWEGVGGTIAEKIVTGLNKINWGKMQSKAASVGKGFADFINGLFTFRDDNADSVATATAEAIGKAINTAFAGISEFVKTLKWGAVGDEFGRAVNRLFTTIEWDKIGETIGKTIKGLLEGIDKFIKRVDGTKIGKAITKVLQGVDWGDVLYDILVLITDVLDMMLDVIIGAFSNVDTGKLSKDTADFVEKIKKWAKTDLVNLLMKAVQAIVVVAKNSESIYDAIMEGFWNGLLGEENAGKAKDVAELSEKVTKWLITSVNPVLASVNFAAVLGDLLFGDHSGNSGKKNNSGPETGGNGTITMSIGLQFTQTADEIKQQWQERTSEIKDKTAELKGKFKQSVNDIKTEWKKRSDEIKTKTAEFKGKFKQSVNDIKKAWKKRSKEIKAKTVEWKGKFKQSVNDIKTAWKKRSDKVKGKTVEITAKLKDAITGALNSMISKINNLIAKLRKISIAGYKPFKDIRDIPKLARGGIVNNPGRGVQATIGEAGREAVLPLDKNTGWMDMLAERLAQRVNGSGQMVQTIITLDGETIAKKVVEVNNRKRVRLNGGLV